MVSAYSPSADTRNGVADQVAIRAAPSVADSMADTMADTHSVEARSVEAAPDPPSEEALSEAAVPVEDGRL